MSIKSIILLTSILTITTRDIDPKKLLNRLNNSNPIMFENFVFNRFTWQQAIKEVQEIVETESNARFVAFNELRTIEDALNALEEFQRKLTLIGENLRHHKFIDFDRRNNTTNVNASLYSFPQPEIDSVLVDITDYCISSLESCVKRVYDAFKVDPAAISYINENDTALLELAPFTKYLQRWEYRATASYYLCQYTIRKDNMLIKFGKSCLSHIDTSYKYYIELADHDYPYDCALLSFCPDFCYGKEFLKKRSSSIEDAYISDSNPCKSIGKGTCELNAIENQNFDDLVKMNINFTCNCQAGLKFFSKFGICIDIDECDTYSHNCFGKHQTCLNTFGSYKCICKRGFKMENNTCERFNSIDEIEDENLYSYKKYNREILINMFKLIHKNKTA